MDLDDKPLHELKELYQALLSQHLSFSFPLFLEAQKKVQLELEQVTQEVSELNQKQKSNQHELTLLVSQLEALQATLDKIQNSLEEKSTLACELEQTYLAGQQSLPELKTSSEEVQEMLTLVLNCIHKKEKKQGGPPLHEILIQRRSLLAPLQDQKKVKTIVEEEEPLSLPHLGNSFSTPIVKRPPLLVTQSSTRRRDSCKTLLEQHLLEVREIFHKNHVLEPSLSMPRCFKKSIPRSRWDIDQEDVTRYELRHIRGQETKSQQFEVMIQNLGVSNSMLNPNMDKNQWVSAFFENPKAASSTGKEIYDLLGLE